MAAKNANVNKISISNGNSKMGRIPSVSLPPIKTCAPGCACAGKCYAAKLCRIRPTVKAAYDRNLDILTNDPATYWIQVEAVIAVNRYFRFHVSGDIPDGAYLEKMIELARKYPACDILAFTKRYDIVNAHAGDIPDNFHLIMSEWPGMAMDNPHNLPVAHVIFKGQEPDPEWKICGGNCSDCACRGVGCWQLKHGEHIAFHEH